MLEKVGTSQKKLEHYSSIMGAPLLEEIYQLGRDLSGLRICHLTSTPFGGAVPEVLFSAVPLETDAGLETDWYALAVKEDLLKTFKAMQNSLQRDSWEITSREQQLYLDYNLQIASSFPSNNYDVVIVHTHRALAISYFSAQNQKTHWVWRCHLDTTNSSASVWSFLSPIMDAYDAAIFTSQEFVPSGLAFPRVVLMTPAIDPLSLKNRDIPLDKCTDFVSDFGLDTERPILLHVSRLDRWKDPLGLIKCYFLAKDAIPDLQLVIISSLTLDDPETFSTLHLVDAEASKDVDIHVYTNIDGVGDLEVNAFQRTCTLGIRKSLREGFGLSIAEMLWKGKPVLGSHTGGIPLQLSGKLNYCLVQNIEECSAKIVRLVRDADYCRELGLAGQENVGSKFLIPRLVRDELKLIQSLVHKSS
jgi:trehalose synthase